MFREDSGYWDLPGGGLDFGESPQTCLTRELEEEAGFQISSMAARPAYFASGLNLEKIWKTIICHKTTVKHLNFRRSKECLEIRFFTKEEALNEKLYPITKEWLKEYKSENH